MKDQNEVRPEELADAKSFLPSLLNGGGWSFRYGGRPSSALVSKWPLKKQRRAERDGVILHTLTSTDPKTGLTMGVGTLMDSEEVVMVISGLNKARALQKILEDEVNHMWTVSMLQLHQHALIVCDDEATMELKVGTVKYFKDIEKENLKLPEL